ncbi:MAG: hypothetical protein K2L96_05500 [Muribaculaceae bacterium]|nr:hypothetical protein [Muribaculaceae bacterium]
MKVFRFLLTVCASVLILSSCGGSESNSGKKFAPKDRTSSSMTDDERQQAIAAKKAAMNVDPLQMMNSNDVKLTVMPPYHTGDITEKLSEQIGVRMLEMIARNGIGGLNTTPDFCLTAKITEGQKSVTGTAPQKMVVEYLVDYQVINAVTGDVYATASQKITGVGNSYPQATAAAVRSIKDDADIQQMLATGSEKIISWFNDNLPTFRNQVDAACTAGDYALALSLIQSVPQKATEAFNYAQSRQDEISKKFKASISSNELIALKQAIQASGNNPSAEVYAHMSLLPTDSKEYAEAQKLLAAYESAVTDKAASDALSAKEKADADAARAHEIKLATIEAERLKAKYQAKATEQALRQHMRDKDDKERGFWGNLGARIIGAIDKSSDASEEDDDDK